MDPKPLSSFLPKQVWGIGSHMPNFTLEGHEKGVNCVDYYTGGVEGGVDDAGALANAWIMDFAA